MSFKDVVKSALTEYMEDLQSALEGLTQQERRFQPNPECNHIDFTVWHMARVEDSIVNRRLRHGTHIWERDDWHKRLELPREGIGEGLSPQRAATLPSFCLNDLMEYYNSVRRETLPYIDSLTENDLNAIPDPERPEWTVAAILAHLIVEEAQHVRQIAYIRGIQRGFEG